MIEKMIEKNKVYEINYVKGVYLLKDFCDTLKKNRKV